MARSAVVALFFPFSHNAQQHVCAWHFFDFTRLDSTRDTGDTHVTRPTQTNSVEIIKLPSARALRGRMKRLLKAEREQFSVASVQSVDDDCGCSNGERAIVLSERVDLFVAS